jgi:alpha-galactosidase
MTKITFMGAGSTVFAKNILGDTMCMPSLGDAHIALYDIDPVRLKESQQMLEAMNRNINSNRARITAHLGKSNRRAALRDARFVINAIQVGGYKPSTIIDFKIPKRYGIEQTIGDTLGIGGIFRTLRTLPVVLDFARDMEAVCPDAWFLNYVNPMAMITGGLLEGTGIRSVGLCHSVQTCAGTLCRETIGHRDTADIRWKIAGINHQAWLLELTDRNGRDLYPSVKRRAFAALDRVRKRGPARVIAAAKKQHGDQWNEDRDALVARDLVRLEIMRQFGYYVTESSEHNAEYCPWFIKSSHPSLIGEYNIPLDEYPRRCIRQIDEWKKRGHELVRNPHLSHTRTHEYGSQIMEAIVTGQPIRIHGNILNTGLITNLPRRTCVEVPCLVDKNGVQGCYVGDLPEQCAAYNRTNINVQLLTVDAVLKKRKDHVYQAAMLDPHTSAELPIDRIRALCDDLFAAHRGWLPALK